jgi:hypothetical protein
MWTSRGRRSGRTQSSVSALAAPRLVLLAKLLCPDDDDAIVK